MFLFPQGESPLFFFFDLMSFNIFLSSCREAGLPWLSSAGFSDTNGEDVNTGDDFPFFPSLLTCVGVIRLEGVAFLLETRKNNSNENFMIVRSKPYK